MYLPPRFKVDDVELAMEVMVRHPFATVTTVADGRPFVNHLPITASRSSDGRTRLVGHMARMNDQWKQMKDGAPCLIAFHGPHAYINPIWYPEREAVPTWNYVTVHAEGSIRVVEQAAGMIEILRELTAQMNESYEDQWAFGLPPDLATDRALEKGIVGFVIDDAKISAKFKLSQHRDASEIAGAVDGLRTREDQESLATAEWMARFLELKKKS